MVDEKDFSEDEDGLDSDDNLKRRTRDVPTLKHNLPNGKLEPNHIKILVMSYALQKNGKSNFKYDEFSSNALGFSNKSISSTFKFFVDIGLMEKLRDSRYKLTDKGFLVAKNLKFDRFEDAKKDLKDLILESWFYKIINTHFSTNDSASIEGLMHDLAYELDIDSSKYKRKLKVLVDYLEFLEILTINDGIAVLNYDHSESINTEVTEDPVSELPIDNLESTFSEFTNQSPNNEQTFTETVNKPITTNFKVTNPTSFTNITVDISISLEITPEMTPDDIKSKLDAIITSFKDKNE
ncbi:hypothetical protein Mpsy_2794 [Methanolobus psychrophilus R15]|nr:hypothetical protein Mpsy_2794 [Methanolobus psychrophilus R15]